ncbi:MAG: efflux RND transporter periplasmic adaptor subunit [Sedimentisphaerales bacterium]|nr:efflux RND transporter periplasmic adaptor subunit [Sedimentisphaerales bacterium]
MPEQVTRQQIAELLTRISRLPSAEFEPPQFFAQYLQLSVAATGSCGGAIWIAGASNQPPQLYCHVELERCNINDPQQQKMLVQSVATVLGDSKLVVVPAGGQEAGAVSNICPYPLFFQPLRAAGKTAMVLQLIGREGLGEQDIRIVSGILEQIAESGQTYLAHRRAVVLDDDRKALARLLKFTENVHESLDPQRVIYQIANHGRDTLACQRVVVWVDPKVRRGLRAVSGVDKPDHRAVQMQAIEKLCRYCLEQAKPIVVSRSRLTELNDDEPMTPLLKDYFNVSNLDQIFLQPIKHEEKLIGVLVAEGFDEQAGANLAGLMTSVARHAGVALTNALDVADLPVVRPLARLKKARSGPRKRYRWIYWAAGVVIALVIGALVPWTIQIDCACELKPSLLRVVESPLDSLRIAEVVCATGRVEKGELIVRLDDDELQTQLFSLQAELEQEKTKLNQETRLAAKRVIELQIEKLSNEIARVNRQIEQCRITAPISGTILTPELELRQGLTVKKGDEIVELADLSQWRLVLDVPQEEVGWVQRALNAPEAKPLDVRYYLSSYPDKKLNTQITDPDSLAHKARLKKKGNVFEVRVDVQSDQLERIGQSLLSGSTGQAKIATVQRPLGYVLLRKVIRFFRVTWF